MKLIVGLGNPGEKYENTRHNLGFMALDEIMRKFEPHEKTFWENDKDMKAEIKQVKLRDSSILLMKPKTYMNLSGLSVAKVLNYYKIDPQNMIVIYDDLDLPFGRIRVRFGGAAGGHHGVESIIEHLGTDKFLRVRLGIGTNEKNQKPRERNQEHVERYVLGKIASNERGKVKTILKETIKAVELILEHGIDTYMSKYNK